VKGAKDVRKRWKEKPLGERNFGRSGDEVRELREGSPKIPEAFARGSFVSVTIRSGYDVSATCATGTIRGSC